MTDQAQKWGAAWCAPLQAVIHCEIVRQAARVVAMDRERLRSGDRAHVRFRFLQVAPASPSQPARTHARMRGGRFSWLLNIRFLVHKDRLVYLPGGQQRTASCQLLGKLLASFLGEAVAVIISIMLLVETHCSCVVSAGAGVLRCAEAGVPDSADPLCVSGGAHQGHRNDRWTCARVTHPPQAVSVARLSAVREVSRRGLSVMSKRAIAPQCRDLLKCSQSQEQSMSPFCLCTSAQTI